MRASLQPNRRAFTLIELLVVVAIIGILAALLFPALSKGKQKAQGVYCLNNGKQMIAALRMYADDFADWLPPNPEDSHSRNLWIGGDIGSESHKWRDRRTQLTGPYAPHSYNMPPNQANNPDVAWLQERTSARVAEAQ